MSYYSLDELTSFADRVCARQSSLVKWKEVGNDLGFRIEVILFTFPLQLSCYIPYTNARTPDPLRLPYTPGTHMKDGYDSLR